MTDEELADSLAEYMAVSSFSCADFWHMKEIRESGMLGTGGLLMTPDAYLYDEEVQHYLPLGDGAVVYEAQRLVETTLEGTIDPDSYDEKWLPVSKPLNSLDMALGVIDWIKSKENEDYIFRVVEITIKRRVIWPEV